MLHRRKRDTDVTDILGSNVRDELDTQREDWLLRTESLHGARPRRMTRERPPLIDDHTGVMDLEAAGGTGGLAGGAAWIPGSSAVTRATHLDGRGGYYTTNVENAKSSSGHQAAFTTTKVPRFDGTTSWEQYKQVFDVIVSSNGWDNDTAALRLFSHLEGDALNMTLLVPLPCRLSRTGLVGTLSAHYGSPGRLADYRRQFEKTTRTAGEDPPYLPRPWRH